MPAIHSQVTACKQSSSSHNTRPTGCIQEKTRLVHNTWQTTQYSLVVYRPIRRQSDTLPGNEVTSHAQETSQSAVDLGQNFGLIFALNPEEHGENSVLVQ